MGDWFTNLAKGVTGALGNAADFAGTVFNAPDLGISEALSGGRKTLNTGRFDPNTGKQMNNVNPFTEGFYNTAIHTPETALNTINPIVPTPQLNINTPPVIDTTAKGLGGTTASSITQEQANPLLASLRTLDTILGNKNAQSQEEFNRAKTGFDTQDILDKQNFEQNRFQNENTLTKNNQAALLNAANASTGLRGVLAGMGGLSGSGLDIIKRLTGLAANADTGNARQTFDTNATNLNTAWNQAEQTQRQRRQDAEATLANNLQNNKASVLTSRQSIFQKLADLFGAGTSEGNRYASEASALAAPIAETTRATVAPYAAPSASFSPAALQSYLAGTQNLTASTTDTGAPINSPVYSSSKKKDQLTGVA